MLKYLLIFNVFFVFSALAQQPQISFSEAISTHLPKYSTKADKAYRTHDIQRAEFLFDSLVNHCLKGSKFDNFKVRNLKKDPVELYEFEKPVYLLTYASWVVPTEGEVPALNQLAEKYHEQVDFIILLWDDRKTTKNFAEKYSDKINVLYVDELQNQSSHVVKMMKHSLGLPTTFLLNKDKGITDIRRKVSHPYGIEFEESFDLNYKSFSEAISHLLIEDSSQYDGLTEASATP